MYLDVLSEKQGFGKAATGGAAGPVVIVNDYASLKAALTSPAPAWVTFPAGMTGDIVFPETLLWSSHKTLDGRGAKVNLRTANHDKKLMSWNGIENVILLGVKMDDQYPNWSQDSEGSDLLNITNSKDFWVYLVSFKQARDGSIDMRGGAVNGTVSKCRVEKNYQAFNWTGDRLTCHSCYFTQVAARAIQIIGGLS